jgi:hypothetical protein
VSFVGLRRAFQYSSSSESSSLHTCGEDVDVRDMAVTLPVPV